MRLALPVVIMNNTPYYFVKFILFVRLLYTRFCVNYIPNSNHMIHAWGFVCWSNISCNPMSSLSLLLNFACFFAAKHFLVELKLLWGQIFEFPGILGSGDFIWEIMRQPHYFNVMVVYQAGNVNIHILCTSL